MITILESKVNNQKRILLNMNTFRMSSVSNKLVNLSFTTSNQILLSITFGSETVAQAQYVQELKNTKGPFSVHNHLCHVPRSRT